MSLAPGSLTGIKVLDLSRVLAGPWCSQILGDLGAEVIKIEQPGQGDDTRRWGPPFVDDGSGDSAYYLCANRNKQSVAIDIAKPEGAGLVRRIAAQSDIVIENFRVGGLAKYGLDSESLSAIKPDLIYLSITGFGQTGPLCNNGGYDFLIQGMSGLMSVTGFPDGAPGGGPMKVGIPISDLTTGLYASIAVLAALNHRNRTGEGQSIDLALLDTQVALLANQASNWMNGGMVPCRLGNQHPNTVPYQDFSCSDGQVLIALGNDRQFRAFADLIGLPELINDERFAASPGRSINRNELLARIRPVIASWKSDDLIAAMETRKLPCGKIQEIPETLEHPQIAARGLVVDMERSDGTPIKVLGFPPKLSASPATYRHAPPRSGQDTFEVLKNKLGMTMDELNKLSNAGVIAEKL